ncbi:MAG: methyltransferase domain-containing protein [Fuerstiella sp.]
MQPRWLPTFFWLNLLVLATLPGNSAWGQTDSNDEFELQTNINEPQIALPEHRGRSPFRSVSRSRRQSSNDRLVQLCQEAVDTTSRRLLSTDQHTPWQMMHALLGLRDDFQILHNGTPVSGLDWISEGQVFDNEYWFESTPFGGRAHPYSRPYAFEGHANQFLAILSMCGVDLNHRFGTSTGSITMRGMIRNAQMTINTTDEPTWTLWALSRYLPSDASWRNEAGEQWSIEKLVQIQTAKPMRGAACGGTHGLFALAHARNVYLRQGKPLRGVWLQAEYKIRQHINTARQQQNSNGTLSSNFFRERKYDPDFNKRMASAGHILEFLMIALPQKELNERWVRRAIEATARDLLDNRKAYVKCSPLYHAVNALNIYLDRVNPKEQPEVASAGTQNKTAAAPKPTNESTAELKTVPYRNISSPKVVGQSDADSSPDEKVAAADPAMSIESSVRLPAADEAKDDVPSPDRQPTPARRQPPTAADTPESDAPRSDTIASAPTNTDRWKATPPERRTPILMIPDEPQTEVRTAPPVSTRVSSTEAATAAPPPPPSLSIPVDTAAGNKSVKTTTSNQNSALTGTEGAERAQPSEEQDLTQSEDSPGIPARPVSSGVPLKIVPGTQTSTQTDTTQTDTTQTDTTQTDTTQTDTTQTDTTQTDTTQTDTTQTDTTQTDTADNTDRKTPAATSDDTKPDDDVETSENRSRVPDNINSPFLDPRLNPNEWVQRFEIESREIFACRAPILRAIGLRPGMSIADIGSGTGLFVGLFSDVVGAHGQVFAIDISPRFVDFLERRVRAEKLTNVSVIQNSDKSLQLGQHRIDRAFICDTYHHFEHYQEMLESIREALRPGGELILIDFDRVPGQSREWILNHVRADKQTFRAEVVAAGFEFVEEVTIPAFKENYLLRFRRPAAE